jgi:membrane-bound lytic murein transglycosylase D
MRQILKEHGLPQDLVYVALIESGFNNTARSHASAVGPWQFIRGTGRRYGLGIGVWVDERRDPVKATHAAAKYLKKLHGDFGHWYLAMAGYNAGEGRVSRAIKDSGSRNFWVHADPDKKYLKAETRDYVPKYIAATIMAKMPKHFGFGDVKYDEPLEYDIVLIPSQTDLDVVAKCVGEGRVDIEDFNPELKLKATPAGVRNYKLKIPKGKKSKFLVAYAKVPKDDRIKLVTHRVRKGEKLARIARKYGVSSKSLAKANGIGRKSRLRAGAQLVIPIGAAYHARVKSSGSKGGSRLVRHKVRRGDTVGKIARKYSVKTKDIRRWNKLNKRNMIRVGQKLKIYTGKGPTRVASRKKVSSRERKSSGGVITTHTVKSGETLWTIANNYDVSVDDLKRWNDLKGNRIKAKQKLVVRSGATRTSSSTEPSTYVASSGSKASSYKVQKGDTPSTIAQKFGIRTKDLVTWNKLNKKRPMVRIGQKLVVGKSGAVASSDVPKKAKGQPLALNKKSSTHTLKNGQTLGHVAEEYGVSTKELMRWNKIKNPKRVRAGKKLVIKAPKKSTAKPKPKPSSNGDMTLAKASPVDETTSMTPAAPSSSSANPSSATVLKPTAAPQPKPKPKAQALTYKIKSGDSLWSIANKHGVKVSDIKKWNKIGKSNKIKPGEKIIIKKM